MMRWLVLVLVLGGCDRRALAPVVDAGVAQLVFDAALAVADDAAEVCAEGNVTRLLHAFVAPPMFRHDESMGLTTLRLWSREKSAAIWQQREEGIRTCLGFHRASGRYLLEDVDEIGAIVVARSIWYLDEKGVLLPSTFNREEFYAYSTLTSPDTAYVAFIGDTTDHGEGHKTRGLALYLLDVARDRVCALGPAVAPPPLPEAKNVRHWVWGIDGMDGFTPLENSIWHFADEKLIVSYGNDTQKQRATKRVQRIFNITNCVRPTLLQPINASPRASDH